MRSTNEGGGGGVIHGPPVPPGAGDGVEDSRALAELLAAVIHRKFSRPLESVIQEVLYVYNEMRYDRCQALVERSRFVDVVPRLNGTCPLR